MEILISSPSISIEPVASGKVVRFSDGHGNMVSDPLSVHACRALARKLVEDDVAQSKLLTVLKAQ